MKRHKGAPRKSSPLGSETIITGSVNFTKAAEETNAENLLVLKGFPELFEKYQRNYEEYRADSEAYVRPRAVVRESSTWGQGVDR